VYKVKNFTIGLNMKGIIGRCPACVALTLNCVYDVPNSTSAVTRACIC